MGDILFIYKKKGIHLRETADSCFWNGSSERYNDTHLGLENGLASTSVAPMFSWHGCDLHDAQGVTKWFSRESRAGCETTLKSNLIPLFDVTECSFARKPQGSWLEEPRGCRRGSRFEPSRPESSLLSISGLHVYENNISAWIHICTQCSSLLNRKKHSAWHDLVARLGSSKTTLAIDAFVWSRKSDKNDLRTLFCIPLFMPLERNMLTWSVVEPCKNMLFSQFPCAG